MVWTCDTVCKAGSRLMSIKETPNEWHLLRMGKRLSYVENSGIISDKIVWSHEPWLLLSGDSQTSLCRQVARVCGRTYGGGAVDIAIDMIINLAEGSVRQAE
ncbi:hypothetical protein BaRGS_00010181 [Batillaria attramentaria]|uniref:Uncharacterized protein n=1 Tax=Batillaria attramentaria TaxID=370345 RepID=A0ABD0LG89_9CAEN